MIWRVAPKYSKSNQRKARKAAACEPHQGVESDSELYRPPPRSDCEHDETCDFDTQMDDGCWIVTRSFYYEDTIADFHMTFHEPRPGDMTQTGLIVASADCRNHGTMHFHDEINDRKHKSRVDKLELSSIDDVARAMEEALNTLPGYGATVARATRR